MEEIILVDNNDNIVGYKDKQDTHINGDLHRAFSIYIFNSNNELLIQKRNSSKYHSGGLWSNTCCSHPRKGEDINAAVYRRLEEEMGIKCELNKVNEFIYKVEFENGLIENEYLHVYTGKSNGTPIINEEEVEDYKWISLKELKEDIKLNPNKYTYWLKYTLNKERFL